MNKKIKRMLSAVSAMTVCAVSLVSVNAGAAYYPSDRKVTIDTTSFVSPAYGVTATYEYSKEITDYFGDKYIRVFVSEPLIYEDYHNISFYASSLGREYRQCMIFHYEDQQHIITGLSTVNLGGFELYNDEMSKLEKYLQENNIGYYIEPGSGRYMDDENSSTLYLSDMFEPDENGMYIPLEMRVYDAMPMLMKIKEDTGYICQYITNLSSTSATDIVNALPEVTLSGDANCDGEVTISDAVLIMQNIANPDEFEMTVQGQVNADVTGDGDGVTLNDALEIQQMSLYN